MTTIWTRDHDDDLVELDHEKAFLGASFGVALVRRGPEDAHVCIAFAVEDDGNWHLMGPSGLSTFWLYDVEAQLAEARRWLDANCTKDRWGYAFK